MSEKEPFEELAGIYDLFPAEESEYIELIYQSIRKRCPSLINKTIVDIGGGTGRVTYKLFDRFGKVILFRFKSLEFKNNYMVLIKSSIAL